MEKSLVWVGAAIAILFAAGEIGSVLSKKFTQVSCQVSGKEICILN